MNIFLLAIKENCVDNCYHCYSAQRWYQEEQINSLTIARRIFPHWYQFGIFHTTFFCQQALLKTINTNQSKFDRVHLRIESFMVLSQSLHSVRCLVREIEFANKLPGSSKLVFSMTKLSLFTLRNDQNIDVYCHTERDTLFPLELNPFEK